MCSTQLLSLTTAAALAAAVCLPMGSAHANLLSNPGFETDPAGSIGSKITDDHDITSWKLPSNSFNHDPVAGDQIITTDTTSTEGDKSLFLDRVTNTAPFAVRLEQSFLNPAMNLDNDRGIRWTFDLMAAASKTHLTANWYSGGQLITQIGFRDNTLRVVVPGDGGNQTIEFATTGITSGVWYSFDVLLDFESETLQVDAYTGGLGGTHVGGTQGSFLSSPTTSTHTVQLQESNQGADGGYFDNIVVEHVAIPEPASVGLVLLGVAAICAQRRR